MNRGGKIEGMNNIPADIARTAKQVSDQLPMVPDDDELEAAIAHAIMAERERCAAIADRAAEQSGGNDSRGAQAEEIAAAIRGGIE